jgi:hypothetical protein
VPAPCLCPLSRQTRQSVMRCGCGPARLCWSMVGAA